MSLPCHVKSLGLKLQTIKRKEVNVKAFMKAFRLAITDEDGLLGVSFPSNLPLMSRRLLVNPFSRFLAPALLLSLYLPIPVAGGDLLCSEEPTGQWETSGEGSDSSLLILAAASLTDVLPKVALLWEEETGIQVRFSFGATSRVAPQILQGIEADIFFSADDAWMEWLQEAGGIREETRTPLLG